MIKTDIAVVGAGPYGLSAAAHLRTIKGLDVRVFGEPMSFWQRNMPEGMLLRSNWTATQIGSPGSALSLEAYQQYSGEKFSIMAFPPSGSPATVPRTSIIRGCQGGCTSSTTKATRP